MKFRKKPVVIEAVKASDLNSSDQDWVYFPEWVLQAVIDGILRRGSSGGTLIRTLEGEMHAEPSDWIIRDVKGELYPCKPDIFAATYEPVES